LPSEEKSVLNFTLNNVKNKQSNLNRYDGMKSVRYVYNSIDDDYKDNRNEITIVNLNDMH
jgi:hypothetical protein